MTVLVRMPASASVCRRVRCATSDSFSSRASSRGASTIMLRRVSSRSPAKVSARDQAIRARASVSMVMVMVVMMMVVMVSDRSAVFV